MSKINGYIVVLYDSNRDISKIGEAKQLEDAQKIMNESFKSKFNEKYGYEMTQRNIEYDEMYDEASGSSECELTDTYAYLNELHHYDYDWRIIEVSF